MRHDFNLNPTNSVYQALQIGDTKTPGSSDSVSNAVEQGSK
jgi:hypothetical protein